MFKILRILRTPQIVLGYEGGPRPERYWKLVFVWNRLGESMFDEILILL